MTKISKINVLGVTHEIKDNDAYVKPSTGIPASDLAEGVIPDVSDFATQQDLETANEVTAAALNDLNTNKQEVLVSGTNVKTINNQSILGSGNININPDLTSYEPRYSIMSRSSSNFTASVEKYYRFSSNVNTITITLPALFGSYTHSIFFKFTTGSSPAVTFSSSKTIIYYSDFAIEANKTYEVNALYNGTEWIVAYATIG